MGIEERAQPSHSDSHHNTVEGECQKILRSSTAQTRPEQNQESLIPGGEPNPPRSASRANGVGHRISLHERVSDRQAAAARRALEAATAAFADAALSEDMIRIQCGAPRAAGQLHRVMRVSGRATNSLASDGAELADAPERQKHRPHAEKNRHADLEQRFRRQGGDSENEMHDAVDVHGNSPDPQNAGLEQRRIGHRLLIDRKQLWCDRFFDLRSGRSFDGESSFNHVADILGALCGPLFQRSDVQLRGTDNLCESTGARPEEKLATGQTCELVD